jgi:hypothetical protein
VRIPYLIPVFVEFVPESIDEGKLYISEEYSTAVHKCCCGCGLKVVTPLKANGWRLTRNGDFVTLYPSIGNWSFPCQSHYWIRRNEVQDSYPMTKEEIDAGRRRGERPEEQRDRAAPRPKAHPHKGFWSWLKELFWGSSE